LPGRMARCTLETFAGVGHGGRTGPAGQPSADLQPQRVTLDDLISQIAAAEPDQLIGVKKRLPGRTVVLGCPRPGPPKVPAITVPVLIPIPIWNAG
jgi:hypothetical protein